MSRTFLTNEQRFSLTTNTTNQRTVLLVMAFQRNEYKNIFSEHVDCTTTR
jgi:hypothetical protein